MTATAQAIAPVGAISHGGAAWACGIALALLMVGTRGQPVAGADILLSAPWAVFFPGIAFASIATWCSLAAPPMMGEHA